MSYFFSSCPSLRQVTLGTNFSFKGNNITATGRQAVLPTPTAEEYTGNWINSSVADAAPVTAEALRDNYDGSATSGNYARGTYVLEQVPVKVVTFNSHGGTGEMNTQEVLSGIARALTANTFEAPSGYSFGGWATSSADADAGTEAYADQGEITTTDDVTLYAIWYRDILFDSGESGEASAVVKQYWSEASGSGGSVTVPPTSSAADLDGWEKLGWTASATADPAGVLTESTIVPDATQYYALYGRTATLSYSGDDAPSGSVAPAEEEQYYNSSGNISTPSFTLAQNGFDNPGFVFTGWDLGDAGAVYAGWTPGLSETPSFTAVAQWETFLAAATNVASTPSGFSIIAALVVLVSSLLAYIRWNGKRKKTYIQCCSNLRKFKSHRIR